MPAPHHYFLDLEGTLIRDKDYEPIPGAVEWLNGLKGNGRNVLIASNNSTHTVSEIHGRLREAGFQVEVGEILTCVIVGIEILREWGARSCLVVGEDSLRGILEEAGLRTGEGSPDAVVVGLDRKLTYGRLSAAVEALLRFDIPLLALHYNRLYLDVGGLRGPSVGAIVRSLEYACRTQAVVAGKPSERFFDAALRHASARPEEVLFVSDDPFSDLAGAKRAGMKTAFVLSGKYPSEAILESTEAGRRPDIVVPSVGQIEV